ncbi:MAG TPA: MBL fold metallo-hydrolase [Pyrinomonadaceae bacterium]|nr:MBL fold metallo-hydrolase [Pyrinomonadaceae bacterium]
MSGTKLYLRQNVQVEPLFNQWYAWTHLIAPQTAAMNIANSHVKKMQSYVAAPKLHADAVRNPAMLGGPFIDYQGGRVAEIRALLASTLKHQAHMLRFAQSVQDLDQTLREEAKGYSLIPLYERVPENLKGYVELVYDLNNHPSIKFVEGLLYQSPYYCRSLQGVLMSLVYQDERPFALSTPRLPGPGSLLLNIPFESGALDELFRMKETPQPPGRVAELLGLSEQEDEVFRTFLTEEPPPPQPRYEGDGISIRYFGHACLLIETRGLNILVDPVISYTYDSELSRYRYPDLPETIDYVLITHGHQDHILFETLLQLRHKIRTVILPRGGSGQLQDPSLKLILRHVGFKNVVELDDMETIEVEGGSITGVPFFGEHADLNVSSKVAHLIRLRGKTFLFAADSNNVEPKLYEHVRRALGGVDVLFLGMECDGAPLSWLYGPLLTQALERKMDQSRRLSGSDYERGIRIVEQLGCREVYVYAMGQEPWLNYIMSIKYTEQSPPIVASNRLIEACRERGIVAERLFAKKEIGYGR